MDSLRGQLLVAGPALVDPNFRRTVVLIGEHGDEGAMGVVLNRVSTALVDEAVPPIASLTGPDEPVYVGGPVQPQAVVVLADFADVEQAEVVVVESIGFLPGEIEDAKALGDLRGVRVFAGYAGWGPGSSRTSSPRAPGSSCPPADRTCSRTHRTPCGATCSAEREATSRSSRCFRTTPGPTSSPREHPEAHVAAQT